MKFFLSALILSATLIAAEKSARACSCAPPQSPSIERERAAAVFSGRVTAVKEQKATSTSPGMMEVVFDVDTAWKGVNSRRISIFTASSSAACGYGFTVGVDYLVYAHGAEGQLRTGLCSRTKRLNDSRADLDELGSGEDMSGRAPGGHTVGSDIRVKVGRKVVLKDKELTLRFVFVGSDSRCPEEARCVWEGDATVRIEAKAGRRSRIFNLHTNQRYAQEMQIGAYIVRLISLNPRPKAGKKLKAADYVVVLRVMENAPFLR